MKTFEMIDISGDAGIRAYGESLEDLFVNAAMGMYSLITDPSAVREERHIALDIESHSLEGLLVSWLNELIFHFDTYGFVGKTIRIAAFLNNKISARVSGEDFDPERHEKRLLIKAATYHQLSIEKKEGQWVTNIIFDI
ncbi:MAG: archease [Nitrospirae bacterium]|nr:archease [Nitrospirota bacterium]MCL5421558.1 archease [Nitrospirota bacterium]